MKDSEQIEARRLSQAEIRDQVKLAERQLCEVRRLFDRLEERTGVGLIRRAKAVGVPD